VATRLLVALPWATSITTFPALFFEGWPSLSYRAEARQRPAGCRFDRLGGPQSCGPPPSS
jgi:hypothetical protein